MLSLDARLATGALLALTISGCRIAGGSTLDAQQVANGGDPQVVARRLFDLEAMRREGIEAVATSPDGSFIAFQYDRPTGEQSVQSEVLAVQDLATGGIQVLTPTPDSVAFFDNYPSGVPSRAISPDNEWILFSSTDGHDDWTYRLKVIRRDGTGARTLLAPFNGPTDPIEWIEGYGWAPDGRSVVVVVWMRDGSSRLELVSLEDGASTLLRAFDWRGPSDAVVSPDGRFVALDAAPDPKGRATDIYVLSVDGSREARLTQGAAVKNVIGWSAAGDALYYRTEAFEAGRSVSSIWRLPMRGDRAAEAATLVRDNIVGLRWAGMNGGRIVYDIYDNRQSYWTVTVDLESGRVVVPPAFILPSPGVVPEGAGSPFGWTRDGAYFWHYRSPTAQRLGWELVLHPLSSGGAERVIPLGLDYRSQEVLLDDATILVAGPRQGRREIVRADLASGGVTDVEDPNLLRLFLDDGEVDPEPLRHPHAFTASTAPDRSTEYYLRERGSMDEIVARDAASGVERVLYRDSRRLAGVFLSPDATRLAFFRVSDPTTPGGPMATELHVMATSGGPSAMVHEGSAGLGSVNWTSDGRTLVFMDNLTPGGAAGRQALRKVDADGRNGMVLLEWAGMGGPRLHPDDRRIVFRQADGPRLEELWVLENLVESRESPRASASR